MKHAYMTITNRGAQVAYGTRKDCEDRADEINAQGGSVFAWVVEAGETEQEDMPGRGFIYG